MREVLILLLVTASISYGNISFDISNASPGHMEITSRLDAFTICDIMCNGEIVHSLSVDNAYYTDLEGFPPYPYICKLILAPRVASVSIQDDNYIWCIQDTLELANSECLMGDDIDHIEDGKEPFWNPGVFLGATSNFETFSITPLYIFPFSYSSDTNILSSMSECNFTIIIPNSNNVIVPERLSNELESLCFNYNIINPAVSASNSGPGDYLVLYTHDISSKRPPPWNLTEYKDALMPLMVHRENLGFNIRWQYISPPVTQYQLQNVINERLGHPLLDIRYIIILGDHSLMPSRVIQSPADANRTLYSDVKYIDSEQFMVAPVISRIPGTPTQIEVVVEKILDYEEYFATNRSTNANHVNNVMLMADKRKTYPWYYWLFGGAPDTYRENCEQVANYNNYNCDLSFYKYYRDDGPFSGSSIINRINSGAGVVSYRGHGSIGSYGWDVPQFRYIHQIADLTNSYTPIVLNISCWTGYHPGQSLSEAWLFNENGGASGVYAATERSYTPPGNTLHTQIYKILFANPYPWLSPPAGRCAYLASCVMRWYHPGGTGYANYLMYNWLGDPGQRMWTKEYLAATGYLDGNNASSSFHISTPGESEQVVSISHNPVSEQATIAVHAHSDGIYSLTLYDLLGRAIINVYEGIVPEGSSAYSIEVSAIPNGIYTLVVTGDDGGVHTLPVLVLK